MTSTPAIGRPCDTTRPRTIPGASSLMLTRSRESSRRTDDRPNCGCHATISYSASPRPSMANSPLSSVVCSAAKTRRGFRVEPGGGCGSNQTKHRHEGSRRRLAAGTGYRPRDRPARGESHFQGQGEPPCGDLLERHEAGSSSRGADFHPTARRNLFAERPGHVWLQEARRSRGQAPSRAELPRSAKTMG